MTDLPGEPPRQTKAFAFGKNWARFLASVNERRIDAAVKSLQTLLGVERLDGRRFLDAGSGSGLFSLAAHRLGADVTSFDVDADSVACGAELRRRFAPESSRWQILTGSLTDPVFLKSLGTFDVVYCWGVAHHTGAMWDAIDNLSTRCATNGALVLAIYNDQLYVSRLWRGIKRIYQRLPRLLRPLYVCGIGAALILKRLAITLLASLLRLFTLRNPFAPFANWIRETQSRGMHGWYDLVDWVGGWPFETARPEAVFRFLRDRRFSLRELTTSPGHGCNEFLFVNESREAI